MRTEHDEFADTYAVLNEARRDIARANVMNARANVMSTIAITISTMNILFVVVVWVAKACS